MQYSITYRQKDKGWQYIISYKDKGAWKQKSKQGFETKKKATLAAAERIKEIEKQLDLESSLDPEQVGITFLEFANQLIEHEKLYKEYNTIIAFNTAIKSFSSLHTMPLNEIKNIHVQKCVDELVMSAAYKISSIKQYMSKINYIFNQAVDPHRLLISNPIRKIKYPSETMREHDKTVKALTSADMESLLSKLNEYNKNTYVLCLTAVTTGLRIGELLGVTWSDIDFSNALLNVNKQWKVLKNKESGFGKLKRKSSYRVVPLPQRTIQALINYRKGLTVIDINNRVFPFSFRYNSFLANLFKKLGYNISVHNLRHTYATNLIANGIDFKTAAQLLGHDVEMTMKTYSHVTDDMLKSAAEKINKIF